VVVVGVCIVLSCGSSDRWGERGLGSRQGGSSDRQGIGEREGAERGTAGRPGPERVRHVIFESSLIIFGSSLSHLEEG
jgi:hypothetical protein